MTIDLTNTADTPEHAELRRAVCTLCEQFRDEYWREPTATARIPQEFVDTLTERRLLCRRSSPPSTAAWGSASPRRQ